MNSKVRHLSWISALASLPVYAISFWFTSKALVRAAFSEGVNYNIERAEWITSRVLAVTTGVLLLASVVLALSSRPEHLKSIWWSILAAGALCLLVWWDYVGIGFR